MKKTYQFYKNSTSILLFFFIFGCYSSNAQEKPSTETSSFSNPFIVTQKSDDSMKSSIGAVSNHAIWINLFGLGYSYEQRVSKNFAILGGVRFEETVILHFRGTSLTGSWFFQ